MRGFLNIDKPAGMTSFDVVRWIRRSARTKRVGHGGTLDPAATGVLPVAVGEATRFVDELLGTRKRYRAEVLLGRETDTYDLDGATVAQRDASAVTRAAIEAALGRFLGEIMQVPPAYSAIKRDGVPAYRAARRGEPLALAARPVAVYAIDVLEVVPGVETRVTLDVACGSGFYVRSLAHDLGAALGVGGTLSALRRTRVGPFAIEDATPLDRACALLEAGAVEYLLHAPDVVLTGLPAVIVGADDEARVRRGLDLAVEPRPGFVWPPAGSSEGAGGPSRGARDALRARCYGPSGDLVAVLEAPAGPASAARMWHPGRVLSAEVPSP